MIVQPAFVGGLVSELGFDAVQAGYVAAAENTGKAIMSIAMMFLVSRINWRVLGYIALLVLLTANLLCVAFKSYELYLVFRAMSGLANGVIIPLCYIAIGLTTQSERNFGVMSVLLLLYSAAVFYAVPAMFELAGFDALVLMFASLAIVALPMIRQFPESGRTSGHVTPAGGQLALPRRVAATLVMYFFFVAVFSVFPYLALMGQSAGLGDQATASVMSIAQFFGIGGSILVIVIANRFGQLTPTTTGMVLMTLAIAMLGAAPTNFGFAAAVCMYIGLWSFMHPFLLAVQARLDSSGRQMAYATAAQMLGIASGPAIAASLLRVGDYGLIVAVSVGSLLLSLALIVVLLSGRAAMGRTASSER